MLLIDEIAIPELTGDKTKRRIYVYLPESYEKEKNRRYPVLYMFDGHNVFLDDHATYGKSWGMKDFLEETELDIIVAAVECNHSPDHGRLKEYTPFSFTEKGIGKIDAKGDLTMEWWLKKFKPMVDKEFRTKPDRENTFIAGSSMGGLMSLYALLQYNKFFKGAAALSPSLWVSPKKITDLIKNAEIKKDTVLYIDYGEKELANHDKMLSGFGKVVSELIAKGIKVNARIIPGGSHCEASWEKQIPFFIETLFYEE